MFLNIGNTFEFALFEHVRNNCIFVFFEYCKQVRSQQFVMGGFCEGLGQSLQPPEANGGLGQSPQLPESGDKAPRHRRQKVLGAAEPPMLGDFYKFSTKIMHF